MEELGLGGGTGSGQRGKPNRKGPYNTSSKKGCQKNGSKRAPCAEECKAGKRKRCPCPVTVRMACAAHRAGAYQEGNLLGAENARVGCCGLA